MHYECHLSEGYFYDQHFILLMVYLMKCICVCVHSQVVQDFPFAPLAQEARSLSVEDDYFN